MHVTDIARVCAMETIGRWTDSGMHGWMKVEIGFVA